MSTRCQIGIYENGQKSMNGFETLLYKHCDGYPEGVVPELIPFLKDFDQKRGLTDTEYLGAWLIHHLIALSLKGSPDYKYLGYGISDNFHSDIEFYYRINAEDKELVVYDTESEDPDLWTEMQRISLA